MRRQFVDIEDQTFNIDPEAIEAAITPRTRAIMPVHLYGHIADMNRIQEIAEKHGLAVIEDACQAVSATQHDRFAGSFGTGAFSFYATKNVMTGEGGIITTSNDAIAEQCRLLRNHGMKIRYYHDSLGFNFRMTDIQAAIGLAQLDQIEDVNRKRHENASYLTAGIRSVRTPITQENNKHAWHQYTVCIEDGDRDEAQKRLAESGVGSAIYYPVPIHQQKYIVDRFGETSFPVSERMAKQVLSLPVHPLLVPEDLELIVTEVNKL
jgi:dTDP-4-amino-4,6-dideoxygalactose transaminase